MLKHVLNVVFLIPWGPGAYPGSFWTPLRGGMSLGRGPLVKCWSLGCIFAGYHLGCQICFIRRVPSAGLQVQVCPLAPGPWGPKAHGPQGPWTPRPVGPKAHGRQGPWAQRPMGPKAHGPQSPWAPKPMGPIAQGPPKPMGPTLGSHGTPRGGP